MNLYSALLFLCVFCVLCSCVLPTYPPTNHPPYLPFDTYSSGLILTWCDICVIMVCDPSVDQFLHGEESGSGESDSDFLLPSYQHHGKSPLPQLPKLLDFITSTQTPTSFLTPQGCTSQRQVLSGIK